MSKLPRGALDLKQFLLRQEVLSLYRKTMKTVRKIPDNNTRKELQEWVRTDFRKNKHEQDATTIKALLHYGKKSLNDLEKNVMLSK